MKILFLGGDKRQLEIINNLYHQKHDIDLVGYTNLKIPIGITKKDINNLLIGEYRAIILPVNGVQDDGSVTTDFDNRKIILREDLFKNTRDDVLIFTGIKTKKLNRMLIVTNRKVVALMEDVDVKKDNSVPTVEGIIGHLVFNTDSTINDSKVLILGYGNVGKMLAEKLHYLGAIITVGVLIKEDYAHLVGNHANVFYTYDKSLMKEAIRNSDIIVNTVPELLLDRECLEVTKTGSYILDIASYPYGVDFKSANDLNIKNKLWLGIPGEVAPKTAGLILTKKINSILRGVK